MKPGDWVSDLSGCITKEKFIAGRTLVDIEKILGYHAGRFAEGIAVIALNELPVEFELAGYSNVATHRQAAGRLKCEPSQGGSVWNLEHGRLRAACQSAPSHPQ